MSSYKVSIASEIEEKAKVGTIVYDCLKLDYNIAKVNSELEGEEYISVTLSPQGNYPFFIMRRSHLAKEGNV